VQPPAGQAGGADGGGVFAFSFIEGALVTAVRAGHWVLLDEINLASSDTLQVGPMHGILRKGAPSITLP